MVYVRMHSPSRSRPLSVDLLLAELSERGYLLSYLRGPPNWEACIKRKLSEQTPNGYVYAVGYGRGLSASIALSDALDTVENDYERIEPAPPPWHNITRINTDLLPDSQPAFDLFSALANLRQPPAPAFRRKL
jgi:hypothetical protein